VSRAKKDGELARDVHGVPQQETNNDVGFYRKVIACAKQNKKDGGWSEVPIRRVIRRCE